MPEADHYKCGPLQVQITAPIELVRRKLAETLELYNVGWDGDSSTVSVEVVDSENESPLGEGSYLSCARMNVDLVSRENNGARDHSRLLCATFRAGAVATGDAVSGEWRLSIPRGADEFWTLIDLESFATLILTEGWRSAGWIPLHAAAVLRDASCAIICAESGGGKTSLTAALVRRGWTTLGDDKLLMRVGSDGATELRGLVHTFNLHPRSRSWFPEVGDLENLPVYSQWSEKRKVHPESIWTGATRDRAVPTHLVRLTRNQSGELIRISDMDSGSVLSTLLHQTVIPSHAATARKVVATIAASAQRLRGLHVDLGDDVYNSPQDLSLLEDALS